MTDDAPKPVPKLLSTLKPLAPMVQLLRPRIPEIRKLKIGKKSDQVYTSQGGREYRRPVKLDHFLVTKTTRYDDEDDENFEVDEVVMRELAPFADADGHVRQVPVRVGSDEVVDVVHSELACYVGTTKVCWGDGKRAFRRLPVVQNGKRGYSREVTEMACPCDLLASGRCKYKGRMLMKLDLPGLAMSGGAMVFRTTSAITLEESYGSLIDIVNDVGGLHGYRLWVVLRAAKVAPEGKPTEVYVIHFENRESDLRALQRFVIDGRVVREQVRGAIDYKALVAATNEETALESKEIATEFYPDALDEEPHDLASGEVPSEGTTIAAPARATPTAEAERRLQRQGQAAPAVSEPAAMSSAASASGSFGPPAVGGAQIDASLEELYALQDEARRKAESARKDPEAAPSGERAASDHPSGHAGETSPAASPKVEPQAAARPAEGPTREPGEDDVDAVGYQASGQRSLIDEPERRAEPPRQGNAAMRNKLSGGKSGGK